MASQASFDQERIRLTKVEMGAAEQAAALDVLRSGMLTGGAAVAELEQAFAREHETAHAVAVSSGTTALVAALRAHRVGPGDEVITSPLTFVATLNAILEVGATVRFADIAEDLTVDPAALGAVLTPRTRAVLPVHLYGLPADMEVIADFASRRGLALIEDAAQAHGARVRAAMVGSFGTAAFSFYATKNITCGEGGIVTTNDAEIAARLRLLRNHGMRERYDYMLPGYNYRLTDLQAAIAAVQLRRLAGVNSRRAHNAARLSAGLAGLDGLVLPAVPAGRLHVWHQYTVRVTARARIDRDQLGKCLDAAGIDARPYYPRLVHDYPCYSDHPQVTRDETPRAGLAVREVLSLPVHPALTDDDISRIVSCVREALSS
jgi:dTDP-4-amino-4,6-dideoxygalactose transaminase